LTFLSSESEREQCVLPHSSTTWAHTSILLYVEFFYEGPLLRRIQDDQRILGNIFGTIPLRDIRSVQILKNLKSLELWRKMSRWLPNLRHIKLGQTSLPEITDLLCLPSVHDLENRSEGARGGQKGIFLPQLEELELYHHCELVVPGWEYEENPPLPPLLQSLCDAVSTRRETRCRLIVTACHFNTVRGRTFLDVFGRWENDQFKVTSKYEFKEMSGK
jgi:hypothetical protein